MKKDSKRVAMRPGNVTIRPEAGGMRVSVLWEAFVPVPPGTTQQEAMQEALAELAEMTEQDPPTVTVEPGQDQDSLNTGYTLPGLPFDPERRPVAVPKVPLTPEGSIDVAKVHERLRKTKGE